MHRDPARPRSTEQVILPSGKAVEVTYLLDQPEHAARPVDPEFNPHICGSCRSGLVQPVEWEPAGTSHWQIQLRCPECEWGGTGVFDSETVARFDEELEAGTEQLLADLHTVSRANFEAEAERFAAALHADLILPEDF
jgi:hypothetical protein